MTSHEPVLKTKDVAEILGAHPKTVQGYFKTGLIEARKSSGGRGDWIVTPAALDKYLNTPYDPKASR